MTNPNNPAFPSEAEGVITKSFGLTTREYFAAIAMEGAIAGSQGLDITAEQFALLSVKLADALIKELSK